MATKFGRVAPSIYVSDLDRSIAFWTGQLGFEVKFTNGAPASFAVLRRDAAEFHLAVNPDIAGKCHCHIMVEGIEDLYDTVAANGMHIIQRLKKQPWGFRDIVVVDPDGNMLELAAPITTLA
jgi:catechol 2,3-dioxygenase-like lactoylglutathione lyase family enzyme